MAHAFRRIESITFSEAVIYSLIGFAVVFAVLIILMAVVHVLRTAIEKAESRKTDELDSVHRTVPQDTASSLVPARGSVGEVSLFTVDDKTAAMLMAIVADESKVPLNELRFVYMHEEGQHISKNLFTEQPRRTMLYKLTVNGKRYEVGAEHCETIMVDTAEAVTSTVSSAADTAVSVPLLSDAAITGEPIKAPLPGIVLELKINEGDAVKAGQVLLILEAMKMENEVAAPHDGKILQIMTSKGSTVETGTILLTLI